MTRMHGLFAARRRWREKVRPRWNEAREPLLAAVALAALILGTIGYLQAPGQHFTLFDSVYRALQLFVFGGAVPYKVPVALQIARFLAPLALGFAAIRGVLHLFHDELEVLRIRMFVRNHVVVVGLGRAGSRLVRSFSQEGWKVVAIERDPANQFLVSAHDRGVPVLIGDAREAGVLRRARIAGARHMFVTCGDDGVNFDVAMAAAERVSARKIGVLTAFVHITDLRLWRGLKAQAVAAIENSAFRLELFNVVFTAAHLMIDRFSPSRDGDGNELDDPHICIVGLEGVGEGLVLRIAATWRERRSGHRLRIRLAGPSADAELRALAERYPAIHEICDIDCRSGETSTASFQRGGVLIDEHGNCDITSAYVALSSQGESLAAALGLHGAPETAHVPVVVALDDDQSGTAQALRGGRGPRFATGLEPFGVLSAALTPAITLQGMNELIARHVHAQYVRERLAAGEHSDSTVPWDQLAEETRESNRRFADGIGAALAAAGCAVAPAPLIDADAQPFHFSGGETEVLAEREHERWMSEKTHEGWRYGPVRDHVRKTHPCLVPWSELSDHDREPDRESMRDLPRLLAGVGLEVYRPAATATRRSGPEAVPDAARLPANF